MSKPIPTSPVVVLVRPQLAENIGATARAMVNFGATDLRLVDPRDFDAAHAARMACDGRDILVQARIFPDLKSALADCAYTIATSRRLRRIKIPPITPREAAGRLAGYGNETVALVFGAEQAGLTNDELFVCDAASTIPTTDSGSLNLGQSVIVYLYEWFLAAGTHDRDTRSGFSFVEGEARELATHEDKQRTYDLLQKLLVAGQYKPISRLPEFMRRVKLLFETRPLTRREQRIFLKMLRHLEKLT